MKDLKMERWMERWHVLLRLSADFHELGDLQAIGATGFDCRADELC